MTIKRILKFFPFFLAVAGVFGFFATQSAQAGAGHNVSGFAWSENIGWVSFNSSNCDTDNNGQSNGGTGCPVAGTAISNYGVNIDASGILSGYAWSEHIGWISFNRSDTGVPPDAPYNGSETYIAKVDLSNKQVSGWARVLANDGGWDGWIKFRGANYGVWLDGSVSPVEFRDWSGSDMVMGWMSFNRMNCDVNKDGLSDGMPLVGCPIAGTAISNYKVITSFGSNQAPQANSASIEYQTYCDILAGQGQIGFKWTYQDTNGDAETGFDFKVNDVNDAYDPSPEIDRSFTGLSHPNGAVNTQSVLVKSPLETDQITFDKTYYWWIKVYGGGGDSGWVAGPSFSTPNHAYPWIDFSWSPESPKVNENTDFRDDSIVYSGRSNRDWAWTFQDGNPASSNNQNPKIKFLTTGEKQIALRVTDSSGYSCSGSKSLTTQIPLPDWREIIPFSDLWDFFSGIPAMAKNFFNNIDLGYLVR